MTDPRPAGLRALSWLGMIVLLATGLPLLGAGLVGVGTGRGRALLVAGLALLVCAAGGAGQEVVARRVRRAPPQARLAELEGEAALHLPRDPGPTAVSTWTLAGLAAVAALAAVVAAVDSAWGWTVAMAVVALLLAWSSGVAGGVRAGGLWLSPTRLVHEDRTSRAELSWDDVTGVVPQQPMPVLVRPDRSPLVTRTGPRGRSWRAVTRDGTLVVDTAHLAGGAEVAAYVIARAITDPASRAVIGTEHSLPPDQARA